MLNFIRPRAVRETSGTVRRAGMFKGTAWIEPCDPMPERKLPLKKRPLELDSKSGRRSVDLHSDLTLKKKGKQSGNTEKGLSNIDIHKWLAKKDLDINRMVHPARLELTTFYSGVRSNQAQNLLQNSVLTDF